MSNFLLYYARWIHARWILRPSAGIILVPIHARQPNDNRNIATPHNDKFVRGLIIGIYARRPERICGAEKRLALCRRWRATPGGSVYATRLTLHGDGLQRRV